MRINLNSACKLGWAVGGGEIWAGGGGVDLVFVVGWPGSASWERGLHLLCLVDLESSFGGVNEF